MNCSLVAETTARERVGPGIAHGKCQLDGDKDIAIKIVQSVFEEISSSHKRIKDTDTHTHTHTHTHTQSFQSLSVRSV